MVRELLEERAARYGSFTTHSKIAQHLKDIITVEDNWVDMSATQKEALDMIAHKIARILNGDPDYADNWVDIAGYAQLVADELEKKNLTMSQVSGIIKE
jgi:hypothetical protein